VAIHDLRQSMAFRGKPWIASLAPRSKYSWGTRKDPLVLLLTLRSHCFVKPQDMPGLVELTLHCLVENFELRRHEAKTKNTVIARNVVTWQSMTYGKAWPLGVNLGLLRFARKDPLVLTRPGRIQKA
jgi:hypothetical protein